MVLPDSGFLGLTGPWLVNCPPKNEHPDLGKATVLVTKPRVLDFVFKSRIILR